mgnify:CR=1 FL=1
MNYNKATLILTLCLLSFKIYAQDNYWNDVFYSFQDLQKKYDQVHVLPPFLIVNNSGKKTCKILDDNISKIDTTYSSYQDYENGIEHLTYSYEPVHTITKTCYFEKGETAVFYVIIEGNHFLQNKLYNPVILGKYTEIHLPTVIGMVDILNPNLNIPNKDTLEYIVTKSKGKYSSVSFTGEELTFQTKKFPIIPSDLLQDKYYWLDQKYDQVFNMLDMYIVNSGGKSYCEELPVQDSTQVIYDIDPHTGIEFIMDTVDVPIINMVCFLEGGKTGIFQNDNNNLQRILPVSDYEEIFLHLNTGIVDILANPQQYDFSEDSVAFFFPHERFNREEHIYDYIVSSKNGKYSVYDFSGYQNQIIQDADVVLKRDKWYFMKNGSLYNLSEMVSPKGEYINEIEGTLFPMLAVSDTMIWSSKDYEIYPIAFYGNRTFHYQWRDKISETTQLYSKTGTLELHEDSTFSCYSSTKKWEEKYVTVDSKVFGMADLYNNTILEKLTALTAWGLDFNNKLVNVPVGSADYFKIKRTIKYLAAQREGEHLLIDLNGNVVKSSKDPIQVHFKNKDLSNCEFVYGFK